MITVYDKKDADSPFEVVDAPRSGSWIHVENATTNDINRISKLIDLEYTDLYDCLDRYEIPRIEKIGDHVLIFTRHPIEVEGGLYTTTFTIILTRDYFITLCPRTSHLIESFITHAPKLIPSQKPRFLICLLLKIAQEFTLQIKKIRVSVLRQEKKMTSVDNKEITDLTLHEEVLNQYFSSLIPLRNVLESIASGRYTSLHEQDKDLLEDLLNASVQSEDLCSTNLRSIRSLRDSYQIIFTNRLNRTIKLLTALTIILSIPTMVASLYGMNVALPLANIKHAFSWIIAIIVVLSIVALLIFQRKKWL
ncbi:MAG: magnesium transporter CorA family protein [Simkaniaceae bacterium]|nr:magnesium transporter CorA family protein [Simkaniaceae bacterium]